MNLTLLIYHDRYPSPHLSALLVFTSSLPAPLSVTPVSSAFLFPPPALLSFWPFQIFFCLLPSVCSISILCRICLILPLCLSSFHHVFYPTLLAYSTFHIFSFPFTFFLRPPSLHLYFNLQHFLLPSVFFSPRLSLSSSVNLQICSFPSLLLAPFFFSTYLLNSPVPLLSYSSWAYSSAPRPLIIWMHWQFFFNFFLPLNPHSHFSIFHLVWFEFVWSVPH